MDLEQEPQQWILQEATRAHQDDLIVEVQEAAEVTEAHPTHDLRVAPTTDQRNSQEKKPIQTQLPQLANLESK